MLKIVDKEPEAVNPGAGELSERVGRVIDDIVFAYGRMWREVRLAGRSNRGHTGSPSFGIDGPCMAHRVPTKLLFNTPVPPDRGRPHETHANGERCGACEFGLVSRAPGGLGVTARPNYVGPSVTGWWSG